MTLPRCSGIGTWDHEGFDVWPGITLDDIDANGWIRTESESAIGSQCVDFAYRSVIDSRFGVPLCRQCFYAHAAHWRIENQNAGLCACGLDTLPNISTCRDCTARKNRQAAAARTRAKDERTRAAAAEKVAAGAEKVAAEKARQREEARAPGLAKVAALTHEKVRAALNAANGNFPKAAANLGLASVPALHPGSPKGPSQLLRNWVQRKANQGVWPRRTIDKSSTDG